MKLTLAFTSHYVIFLSMTMLLTPLKFICSLEKVSEIKIEKKQPITAVSENAAELLHGELLFRY